MSLPWFSFYIDPYLGDTMALDTEGHGAYLLLMLHYYRNEAPPRDDNRALAAITRMSMSSWLERRPEIERFFRIEGGVWRHERVEKEIGERSSKLATSRARAKAASSASHAKRGHKPAPSQPQAGLEPNPNPEPAPSRAPSSAPSQPQASTLNTIQEERKEDSSSYALTLLKPLPSDYRLSEDVITQCHADGATEEDLAKEFDKFILHHREAGSLSADWEATWGRWWLRWKDHRAKLAAKPKAPPRVEVNNKPRTPTPASWFPNERHEAMCIERGYDLDEMVELFRDVGRSNGYRYIDHDAAFRNFIKNQQNFKRGSSHGVRQNSSPGRGSIVHAADVAIAHLEREVAADNEMRAGAVVGVSDE